MHIAASKPEYISRDEVPAERVEKEKEILRAQALNEGKPEKIVERWLKEDWKSSIRKYAFWNSRL